MKDLTPEDQVALTVQIMDILDGWGLSSEEVISLIALPEKTPLRAIRRYRENTAFPVSPELEERISHIIGITDALRTSYPHNPQMSKMWMKQKSKKLNNKIPVQILKEEGYKGLVEMRKHLDCSYDWNSDQRENK